MDCFDVLIVGGGPAGSSCAWALRKVGIDSVILDALDFPRSKLCAGWITPAVVHRLEMDISEYPHSFLTFRKIHIEFHGKRSIRRWNLRTIQHSIRRFEFDHWLLQRCGAQFRKHKVCNIRREGGQYVVDDMFRCKFLVGAAGTQCPVRRTLFSDLHPRKREFQVAALEEEFFYPDRDDSCRLWFSENRLAGYSWFVPKGNGWLNVGLGAFSKHLDAVEPGLRDHWQLFVRRLSDSGLVRGHEFDPGGYTYFVRAPAQTAQCGNCFLVGDSAGLATRDLAEGIGPAIESGLLAAKAILTGKPYALEGMTKYSYISPGWATGITERIVDRDGGFFRDRVFGRR